MRTIDLIRTILARYHAGIVDRVAAVAQIDVLLEQTKLSPAEVLFDLADDDTTKMRRLRDLLAAANHT